MLYMQLAASCCSLANGVHMLDRGIFALQLTYSSDPSVHSALITTSTQHKTSESDPSWRHIGTNAIKGRAELPSGADWIGSRIGHVAILVEEETSQDVYFWQG